MNDVCFYKSSVLQLRQTDIKYLLKSETDIKYLKTMKIPEHELPEYAAKSQVFSPNQPQRNLTSHTKIRQEK